MGGGVSVAGSRGRASRRGCFGLCEHGGAGGLDAGLDRPRSQIRDHPLPGVNAWQTVAAVLRTDQFIPWGPMAWVVGGTRIIVRHGLSGFIGGGGHPEAAPSRRPAAWKLVGGNRVIARLVPVEAGPLFDKRRYFNLTWAVRARCHTPPFSTMTGPYLRNSFQDKALCD